MTTISE